MLQQDMSMESYLEIMNAHIRQYGQPDYVSLQGEGEPTLNKHFFDMAAYARSLDIEPFTITNGTYKYPQDFKEHFTQLGISIDTLDAEEASRIGRHNLERTLAFIEEVSGFLKVIIYSVALSPAVHRVAEWCRQHGYQHVIQGLQPKPDYQYRYPQYRIVNAPVKAYRCHFLEDDIMRYYAIDGTCFPCCFIKDSSQFTSVDQLKQELAQSQTPASCKGCRYLS